MGKNGLFNADCDVAGWKRQARGAPTGELKIDVFGEETRLVGDFIRMGVGEGEADERKVEYVDEGGAGLRWGRMGLNEWGWTRREAKQVFGRRVGFNCGVGVRRGGAAAIS